MTPRMATTHFDDGSLRRLRDFVGGRWNFVTGDPLPEQPGCLAAFDYVIAAIEGRTATVHSRLALADFEGYEGEYPRLSVGDTDPEALEAWRKSGRTFFCNSGQTVRSVLIVREEITALRDGDVQWVYSTDIGVVFELSEGALGIVKASHHIEALRVSFGDTVDALDLPDRTIEWDWDNELGEEYRTMREFIDVQSLLTDPPPTVAPRP